MSTRTSGWPTGMPCWADLMAPDMDTAMSFYGEVLGWAFPDIDEQFGGYRNAEVGDAPVAGIGPEQPGARMGWTLYFATDEADATAEAVIAAGGTLVRAPGDLDDLGRMAIAQDPTGALFGLWQPGDHIGAGRVNEAGAMAWEELRSPDPDAARAFYRSVFRFDHDLTDQGPDGGTFSLPGEDTPIGAIGGMDGSEEPPRWIVYFMVADADAAVAAVERAGGSVHTPVAETPYGRVAAVRDPFDALFHIVENTGQPIPDRSDG